MPSQAHPLITVCFGHTVHAVTAAEQCANGGSGGAISGGCDGDDGQDARAAVQVQWKATAASARKGGQAATPPFPAASATQPVRSVPAATGSIGAAYVLAADGAGSSVRQAVAIPLLGSGPLQHLINVHFRAPGLAASNAVNGMLYFVYNKRTVCVVVAHDIQAGEYVAQIPYFPEFESAEQFTLSECRRLVRAAIGGQEPATVHILSIRKWTMTAAIAQQFRQGRVFLVGDACHQFPPSGAFGMNTGLVDVHNLAWKLAAVLDGIVRATFHPPFACRQHRALVAGVSAPGSG